MGKIISCNNQKGGSGKTATSVNIAKGLADEGFRTLLVDLDLQGNTSSKFREDFEEIDGIYGGFSLKENYLDLGNAALAPYGVQAILERGVIRIPFADRPLYDEDEIHDLADDDHDPEPEDGAAGRHHHHPAGSRQYSDAARQSRGR
ncbi:MAG: AAA family ATPase, partial [Erysipelotrichaceae bacterium]|nr:AAA family ATPase [Erysipelotrichaceae bacterium]